VADRGFGTSSKYMRDLIRRHQDRQRLRGLLLEGANSDPRAPADTAYFDQLRARVRKGRSA
jgi:antitoxin ParD1/3/4